MRERNKVQSRNHNVIWKGKGRKESVKKMQNEREKKMRGKNSPGLETHQGSPDCLVQ